MTCVGDKLDTIARMEACEPGTIIRTVTLGEYDPWLAVRSRAEPDLWVLDGQHKTSILLYALAVTPYWEVIWVPTKATWDEVLAAAAQDTQADQLTLALQEQWHDSVCACLAWRPQDGPLPGACVNGARPPTSWPVEDMLGVLRAITKEQA